MRRRVLAAALVGALAVRALAGTGWSSFDLAYADDDTAVATQVDRTIGATIERAWSVLEAGERWNEATAGPFSLVKRDAEIAYEQPGTGRIRVEVSLTPTTAVPSEAASARALAERLLDALQQRVGATVQAVRQAAVAERRSDLRRAEANTKTAAQRLQQHIAEHGDLETSREIATARLRAAAADLADTRIERAVTARRMDAARAAVERAAEAADLRAQMEAVQLEMQTTGDDPLLRNGQLDRLDKLRALLREAETKAPPLDVARQRVFDLEVELVGLEAREALLEPEVANLRAETVAIATARRAAQELARAVDAARAEEERLVAVVRDLERAARKPSVVVIQFRTSSR